MDVFLYDSIDMNVMSNKHDPALTMMNQIINTIEGFNKRYFLVPT